MVSSTSGDGYEVPAFFSYLVWGFVGHMFHGPYVVSICADGEKEAIKVLFLVGLHLFDLTSAAAYPDTDELCLKYCELFQLHLAWQFSGFTGSESYSLSALCCFLDLRFVRA